MVAGGTPQKPASGGASSVYISADDWLPMLVLIILRAHPSHPFANIDYMKYAPITHTCSAHHVLTVLVSPYCRGSLCARDSGTSCRS
jgi:hypothetical protein